MDKIRQLEAELAKKDLEIEELKKGILRYPYQVLVPASFYENVIARDKVEIELTACRQQNKKMYEACKRIVLDYEKLGKKIDPVYGIAKQAIATYREEEAR